jgi:hypothetical protein
MSARAASPPTGSLETNMLTERAVEALLTLGRGPSG